MLTTWYWRYEGACFPCVDAGLAAAAFCGQGKGGPNHSAALHLLPDKPICQDIGRKGQQAAYLLQLLDPQATLNELYILHMQGARHSLEGYALSNFKTRIGECLDICLRQEKDAERARWAERGDPAERQW